MWRTMGTAAVWVQEACMTIRVVHMGEEAMEGAARKDGASHTGHVRGRVGGESWAVKLWIKGTGSQEYFI